MRKQRTIYELKGDIATVRALFTVFHPDAQISNDQLAKMIQRGNYHWMAIRGKIRDYGVVDILIDDMKDRSGLWGSGHKEEEFKRRHSTLEFRMWRTSLDVHFRDTDYKSWKEELKVFTDSESYQLFPQYNKILQDAGYRVKNIKEWIHEYYKD